MYLNYLLNGFFVGFVTGIPVGPIGVMVVQKMLLKDRLNGLICGFGSASADAVYGFIFAFGLKFISEFIISNQYPIQVLGSILILLIGLNTLFSKSNFDKQTLTRKNYTGSFASTFIISATNPVTLISYATLLAGFGLKDTNQNNVYSFCLVLGVFCGAFIWWLILAIGVSILHNRLTPNLMCKLNKVFGALLSGLAVFILISRLYSII